MKKIIILTVILCAYLANADNTEEVLVFEPATLKKFRSGLQNRIKFPKIAAKAKEDVNVVVRCDAYVKVTGKLSSNYCYESGKFYFPYVTAINRAADGAVVRPARINDKAKKVYFQYFVVFMKEKGKTSIDVIPNSGLEMDKYGFDYSSAQRYMESSGRFGASCRKDRHYTVNTVVSALGVPEAVTVSDEESAGIKCITSLKKSFLGQRFIPAIVDDVPVTSFYSERVFSYSRGQ